MINPVVTYRIQFNKDFTFQKLEKIIPYLHSLGVGTIYASPIFEAVPGSVHGYDVINPHRINPEIGTLEELRAIRKKLKSYGMQWIQDIVPNHMAFHSDNLWLMDVFEKGRHSIYSSFFDLAWTSDLFHGRIIVPFLGEPLKDIVSKKELRFTYFKQRLMALYHEQYYPLNPRSYALLLKNENAPEAIQQFTQQISDLHLINEPISYNLRWHELVLQWEALMQLPNISQYVHSSIHEVNIDETKLKAILDEQTYSLTHWQLTDRRINFRRFFTVNELIGLNMQNEKVFHYYHQFIDTLLKEEIFQGLRIDHIDGLYDPTLYLERLRNMAGPDVYIAVEKILMHDEKLPEWPIQGSTGYEFLAHLNQVMTYFPAERKFTSLYHSFTGESVELKKEKYEKKKFMLQHHMGGELENLYGLFIDLKFLNESQIQQAGGENIRECIGEFLIRFPVYRFYGNKFPLEHQEAEAISKVLDQIHQYKPELHSAVELVKEVLLNAPFSENKDAENQALQFYMRCMQFTGPLTAKGIEDTLYYTYNRFIAHNEVGDSPTQFGISPIEFHRLMQERQNKWPLAMSTTSTHDTKRGEDVRARLTALSAMPEEWVAVFHELKSFLKTCQLNGMPDKNDQYLIIQTILGALASGKPDSFRERLEQYAMKALRESKRYSNWTSPNEEYENATLHFIQCLLEKTSPFFQYTERLISQATDAGYINSLSQLVLKFTCPGVPDIYQGCERWDYSLVDPDNRRAVGYEDRSETQEEFANLDLNTDLLQRWQERSNGKIKQGLTYFLAQFRSKHASSYLEGEYVPITTNGIYKDHVLAFARRHKNEWFVTVIPLHVGRLTKQQEKNVLEIDWKNTELAMPSEAPSSWTNLIANYEGHHSGTIPLRDVFKVFPFALLTLKSSAGERGAGVLLHVTSLPSPFHIGDLGPQAFAFADFLHLSRQSFWQLLPLNPTHGGTGHSPYSSFSSMAGNTLLISPEFLVNEGDLSPDDIIPFGATKAESKVDYEKSHGDKNTLYLKAWKNFKQDTESNRYKAFQNFTGRESLWLHDFSLYVALKNFHQGLGWNKWPEPFKHRHPEALQNFYNDHRDEIEQIKWLQFTFDQQWNNLKAYCNKLNIQLIGDLPYYVVLDSVDVWSHPEIFSLDENHEAAYVAGVPPDYFNADGQLWGMPVFNWDILKKTNYAWWTQRLKKNVALFDVVRLDHFRAFSDFWNVSAKEKTAAKGEWKVGPGADFFEAMKKELGDLPFIAEDLGEITPDVYKLRDSSTLPGMKVLQFAFGEDLSRSPHAPHNIENNNFVMYTGTHDNNTTVGWFEKDLNRKDKVNLQRYVGSRVNKNNIHHVLIRFAYASICKLAIVPMQDILGLNEEARMNTPGSVSENWLWRLKNLPKAEIADFLRELTLLYNRV